MKLPVQNGRVKVVWRLGICVAWIAISSVQADVHGQIETQSSRILRPARSMLAPVHMPNLSQLERDVRDQLESRQASLTLLVNNPSSTDAKLSEAYGSLGEVYDAYSLSLPARECYLNAIRLAPKDFRWNYLLARLDHQAGRFEEAISRYRLARILRADYVATAVNLGNLYLELNRLEDAKESFAAALAIQDDIPAAYYGLGQAALSRGSFAEAVIHLQKALALAPEANRIHYPLAMAYRGLKDAAKARAHLARQGLVGVRVADPLVDRLQELVKGERVHTARGRSALEAKRYAEAIAEFRRAIDSKPDSIPARVNLGVALIQKGDLKAAVEQFEETLRLDPNNSIAHYNLSILLAIDGNHQQAISHLQAVLKTSPNDLDARFLLGQQLSKSSRFDEALKEFSFIVQANPNNEAALLEQVKLLELKGRHKEALDAVEKGHTLYPQKEQTVATLAYLLAASPQYDLRDGARALKLAQKVHAANQSLKHGLIIAIALAELGRCNEAGTWQRKMIATAEQESNNQALLANLKSDLERYESGACRPFGERP